MNDKTKRRLASLLLALCLTSALPSEAAAAGVFFPAAGADTPSLADALASLGADSSFAYRAEIAIANGYRDYAGTAGQNTALLYLLRRGRLRRPDKALSPGAKTLYCCMAMECGGKREFLFPRVCALKYGFAEKSFRRYITELEARGFLIRRSMKNLRRPNEYSFSFVWKGIRPAIARADGYI